MDKSSLKMAKVINLAIFLKTETCGQTVLPDGSILIRQKLVENAKIEQFFNATFWVIFKHCAYGD